MDATGGSERTLHGPGAPGGTIVDFWRWAFTDILVNTTRGVFAEWLVAQLLEIPMSSDRVEWDTCDLITPEGVRIEVKSGAYRQKWHTNHPVSKIIFSGLRARVWSADTGLYSAEQSFNADIYAFCVQIQTDMQKWDAFDLNQWRFYALRKADIERLNQNSIGLATLRRLTDEMDAPAFQERMRRELAAVDVRRP
ncbi:MAG: hypothetical protein WCJ64_10355 [Rhodospirillaceae bacterium]